MKKRMGHDGPQKDEVLLFLLVSPKGNQNASRVLVFEATRIERTRYFFRQEPAEGGTGTSAESMARGFPCGFPRSP